MYIRCGLIMDGTKNYCKHCGSTLGIDCGEAEPDYNEHYCSKGCYELDLAKHIFADVNEQSRHKFTFELI